MYNIYIYLDIYIYDKPSLYIIYRIPNYIPKPTIVEFDKDKLHPVFGLQPAVPAACMINVRCTRDTWYNDPCKTTCSLLYHQVCHIFLSGTTQGLKR